LTEWRSGIAKPFCRHPATPFRAVWARFLACILFVCPLSVARAQTQPSSAQETGSQAPVNAQKPDAAPPNDEIVSRDTAFKLRVNLVLVRVVVRDATGKGVTNLRKEDFQLEDNRKLQIISSFSVETPASHVPTVKADTEAVPAPSQGTQVDAPELPHRFVTLFFDDIHLSVQDAILARQAATKLFGAMQSSDRLSIFTTSGQVQQEFTADRNKLEEAIQRILPHPLSTRGPGDCPPLTFYEAYLIVEAKDPDASQVAAQDATACAGRAGPMLVQQAAQRELTLGESELQFSFRSLDALIRRMSALPGQRILVMTSPGFFVTPSMRESNEIIERATKANIVINTIDARGLYVSSVYDASNKSMSPIGPLVAARTAFITAEESMQQDILAELADGTGGVFFHNRNDIDQGLLQAAAEPEVSYVLGFVPQNLKLDGKYHHLKVTLVNKQKWALQARHGYFAPHGESDPEAAAQEEMQQAIYSQDEMRELPITCQTQFLKGANGVRLFVVAHLETKGLKFRKVGDRNTDKLTTSTVIFDGNGNLLTGQQRSIDLRLKDASLERVNKTGISIKSSFDLQPGNYLVRIVLRDSEGSQMAAMNQGVVIP
jgi:VWFA-related protein